MLGDARLLKQFRFTLLCPKLKGVQLVASANAMTDLAIGFIGTLTDPA